MDKKAATKPLFRRNMLKNSELVWVILFGNPCTPCHARPRDKVVKALTTLREKQSQVSETEDEEVDVSRKIAEERSHKPDSVSFHVRHDETEKTFPDSRLT